MLTYRNQGSAPVNQILTFDGDLVGEGLGTYPVLGPGQRSSPR